MAAVTPTNELNTPTEASFSQNMTDEELNKLFDLEYGNSLSGEEVSRRIDILHEEMLCRLERCYGYQGNQTLNYSKDLGKFLNMHINNAGDPHSTGGYTIHTKFCERAVIRFISKLWHAPVVENHEDRESTWGYVLSMGCTEGNLYALRNARDYLAGKFLLNEEPVADEAPVSKVYNGIPSIVQLDGESKSTALAVTKIPIALDKAAAAYTPVLFYSDQTHYSVDKIRDILCLQSFSDLGQRLYPGLCPINDGEWPERVGTHPDGSVNIDELEKLVLFFAKLGYPIMVCFNYGSTFKGAYDDVDAAYERLMPIFTKYGQARRSFTVHRKRGSEVVAMESIRKGYWFHVDGALGAAYGSLFDASNATQYAQTAEWLDLDLSKEEDAKLIPRMRSFDFSKPNRVQSIAMSGHKEIGAPFPTGVVLTKRKYMLDYNNVSYIASIDSTLSGSRNGLAALVFWHYFASKSLKEHTRTIYSQLSVAKYAAEQLALAMGGYKPNNAQVGNTVMYHENSLCVLFWKPSDAVVEKFSLSIDKVDGELCAHIFCMPHVTKENIDALAAAVKDDHVWKLRMQEFEAFKQPAMEPCSSASTVDERSYSP